MLMSLDTAKSSKALTMGTSPFITGAKFQITGYNYEQIEDSDNFFPVFETTIGTVSVQSLLRAIAIKPYTDKDGNMITTVQPTGTFHDRLRELLREHRGETADEVLPKLVNALKDKTYVVRKREYVTIEGKYGGKAKPVCHVDIVND